MTLTWRAWFALEEVFERATKAAWALEQALPGAVTNMDAPEPDFYGNFEEPETSPEAV